MKIRTLLLGSAAALIAVSGAQAADAVIVEPEPVEYVRICDAYGAGYFYIPGTETCIRFSGYVRVDYTSRHIHDGFTQTKVTETAGNTVSTRFNTVKVYSRQRHQLNYRGRLNIDVQNETEWGTLRSQLRFQGDGGTDNSDTDSYSGASESPADAAVVIDRALISLAGFRVGYSDDYWTTHGGYGYYKAEEGGPYGYSQGIFLDYTYAADGFTATVGLVDNRRSGQAGQPDAYVGADYSGSWGRVWGTYHYDSSMAAGAWKAGAELSLADYIPGGAIKGWYASDNGGTDYVKGHQWGVTGEMNLADNLILFAGYGRYDCGVGSSNSTTPCTAVGNFYDTSYSDWNVGTRWNMATGLYMQVEYHKQNYDYQKNGAIVTTNAAAAALATSRLSTGTLLVRVVRSF